MSFFQLLMLGASAYFAYKIYEHIQTLQDSEGEGAQGTTETPRTADAFSTFDVESLIAKADEARENGNLDKALAIYSEAKIKDTGNAEVLFKMGYTLSLQGREEEALEYFKEALEIDKNNPFTHLEMAYVYIEDGEYASARNHLNIALEIDPELEKAKVALEKLNEER